LFDVNNGIKFEKTKGEKRKNKGREIIAFYFVFFEVSPLLNLMPYCRERLIEKKGKRI